MTFKRVVITRRGGPEVLRIVEETVREPAPGEVRIIRTLAAGSTVGKLVLTFE
jgi:NADPH:quinone reductase-like Zn-dependent oxidoreductase